MMFSIFGLLAEFEFNLIGEQVIEGQNRAKAKSVYKGRQKWLGKTEQVR